jgi:hypothetical protein
MLVPRVCKLAHRTNGIYRIGEIALVLSSRHSHSHSHRDNHNHRHSHSHSHSHRRIHSHGHSHSRIHSHRHSNSYSRVGLGLLPFMLDRSE